MRVVYVAVASFAVIAGASAQTAQTLSPEQTMGNPSQAPYKWAGLLIIPSPTPQHPNESFLCTAQFIRPNVLLTAGHCLKDLPSNPTGPWPDVTKGAFYLQYQNGAGTQFNIVCGETNPLWTYPSNYPAMTPAQQQTAQTNAQQHDYAMILVDKVSPTGVMNYQLDWKGKYTFADRIGYPGDILDGTVIQDAPGVIFPSDAIPLGVNSSPNLVVQWGPVTDATEGMSGGAWVANSSDTEGPGKNVLIAVTSFGVSLTVKPTLNVPGAVISAYPGGTFAAYLTAAEFNPLLDDVSKGCHANPTPVNSTAAPAAPIQAPGGSNTAAKGSNVAPKSSNAPAGSK
jgi:hypothetical protein